MKRIYLVTALLTILCSSAFSQAGVLDPNDPEILFTSTYQPTAPAWGRMSKWGHTKKLSWNTFTAGYKCYYFKGMAFRLKFPKSYTGAADGKTYPVFIFFHGLGERGPIWDNDQSLLWGGQQHGLRVDDGTFDGFLLYPQNQTGYMNAYFGAVADLIDSMAKYVKADIDRVTLSGLSAGAQGDWPFCADFSKYISSLIPISAARPEDTAYFPRYVTIPVWVANGGLDINPDPASATQVFNAFKRLGGNLRQTFYPDQGHSVWSSFWNRSDYFPYLSTTHKANPLVYFGRTQFCANDTINAKLGVQDGFYAYEWQKDGVIIPGATSSTLIVKQIGTYSVHFKRTATSNWSAWSPTPVVISIKTATVTPPIQVNGTFSTVLPAADGNNTVPLMVPNNYVSYEWRRVNDNVVVGNSNIYNAPVGQYKVQVTEQYGCSSSFSAPFTVISANGTNVPDKISNLTAIAQSNTSIQLDWSDNPTPQYNETGFEIYRGTNAGGPYTLVQINPADNLSYLDATASPNTKYYYIIRPVNNNGAGPLSSEVSVVTKSDTQPPTAPGNLRIAFSTRSSITLVWDASSDDVGIGKYIIYVNGVRTYTTNDYQFVVNNLDSFATYNFYVKAQDLTGNISTQSNQVTGVAKNAGLTWKYYEGSWSKLPDFNALTPVNSGYSNNVDISLRQVQSSYGFLWQGFISIRKAGTYLFETSSDDGSRLYIGQYSYTATPVVDNDGSHASVIKGGNYTFPTPGMYPIAITYYQGGGNQSLNVYWTCSAAGIPTRTVIPDSAFTDFVPPAGIAPLAPASLKAIGIAYNKIQLNWTDNSSNETGYEIYRSTTLNGNYNAIAVLPANANSYLDSTCSASTKYYYKIRAIGNYGESSYTQNGIEAQWELNNSYADSSGNGQTITLSAGVPLFDAASPPEGSYSWKNNGAVLSIASTNKFLQESYSTRTIAFWMKPLSTSNRMVLDIGGSDNGIAMQFSTDTLNIGIASGSNRIKMFTRFNSLAWNHIALVYNGNSLLLYINGVLTVSNTSLPFNSILPTTGLSRIGGSTGTNALNASGSNFSGWLDNFEIINNALNQSEILALKNNTFIESAATTMVLPSTPAAPTNLTVTAQSSSRISINWNDNSSNETGFELWRSTNNNSTYRLISSLPANNGTQVSYQDTGLYANVTYYYKVLSKGIGGNSTFSNEGSAKTLNIAPILNPIANVTMRYDAQRGVNISTINADGDIITLTVNNLPSFGSFTSSGGNGTILFNPNGQQGTFTMQVVATDNNGGSASQNFTLTVNSNYPPSINALANVTMPAGTGKDIALSATDPDGVTGLNWSSSSLPSFVSITTNADGTGNLHLQPGYANVGTFTISVTATDVSNGTDTKSFVLTTTNNIPVTSTVEASVRNYPYSYPAPSPWNSISTPTSTNLTDLNGNTTPIGLAFQTTSWSTESFGAVTGNNSGVYPDEIIKDHYWFGIYGRPDTVDVKITGLSKTFKYNVTLFASSNFSQFPD
ncbi:MAG: fibronectin type III domain-containing protein, partial [Flavisolibacter sp.]